MQMSSFSSERVSLFHVTLVVTEFSVYIKSCDRLDFEVYQKSGTRVTSFSMLHFGTCRSERLNGIRLVKLIGWSLRANT